MHLGQQSMVNQSQIIMLMHLQEYVELLASNMVEAQGDESSPAAGRVRGLVNELTGYACTMVKLNPEVMHAFFSRESNSGSAASLQWRHILVRGNLAREEGEMGSGGEGEIQSWYWTGGAGERWLPGQRVGATGAAI